MRTPRTLCLPEVGTVLFTPSARAKYVNITVRPFRGTRVAVPRGVCLESAKAVVWQKRQWIKDKQQLVERMEQEHRALIQRFGYISRPAAKGIISERLAELAERHGIAYNKLSVRNQKTRWGSCSSGKNISLNYKITLLPRELMDYIILHELAHIKHANHSPAFWAELDKLVGDAKTLDAELHKYQGLLIETP